MKEISGLDVGRVGEQGGVCTSMCLVDPQPIVV